MGNLRKPGERLREYREYLGMTLGQIEAWCGVKESTWSYAETEGKGISSKILDALRKVEPPPGKQKIDVAWLMDGDGFMVAEATPSYVTSALPDRRAHVRQASRMLLNGIRESGLEGLLTESEENLMIDVLADGISSERPPDEIAERLRRLLDLAARALRKEPQ